MTDMSLIGLSTNKLKACGEEFTLGAEIQQACNTDDELFAARLLWSEINGYQVSKQSVTDASKATPGIIVLDAEGVHDVLHDSSSTALGLTAKRNGIELLGLKRHCGRARYGCSMVSQLILSWLMV